MRIVIVEPNQPPREADVEPTLETYQSIVGGHIEAVNPFKDRHMVLVCNEEGKINRLECNRFIVRAGKMGAQPEMIDWIAGTCFICGIGEEDFTGLTPEQAAEAKQAFASEYYFIG